VGTMFIVSSIPMLSWESTRHTRRADEDFRRCHRPENADTTMRWPPALHRATKQGAIQAPSALCGYRGRATESLRTSLPSHHASADPANAFEALRGSRLRCDCL